MYIYAHMLCICKLCIILYHNTSLSLSLYIYIYVHIHTYIYIYTHIYTYMYIHSIIIHTLRALARRLEQRRVEAGARREDVFAGAQPPYYLLVSIYKYHRYLLYIVIIISSSIINCSHINDNFTVTVNKHCRRPASGRRGSPRPRAFMCMCIYI